MMYTPRYPIFIPSKGRVDNCLTPPLFVRWHVPFTLVVEPQEETAYRHRFPDTPVLVLPDNNQGLIYARNWIWEYSVQQGDERHWQIDDNIREYRRRYKTKRLYCDPNIAIRICEDFTDRYENVALSGLNYYMFVPDNQSFPPFHHNCHVYSNTLIYNDLPYRYRPPANEDVDLCLQVLSSGEWCTIALNVFLAQKVATMRMKGGQTDAAYQADGRLFMAKAMERVWPGVVETKRRYHRPQHVVKDAWQSFDTPLRLKDGLRLEDFPAYDEHEMTLTQTRETIQHPVLRQLYEDYHKSGKE
jgi:TET-associated glycosyltransferase-like protein